MASNENTRVEPPLSKFYVEVGSEVFRIGDRVSVEVPAEGFTLRGRVSGIMLPAGASVHDESGRGEALIVKQHRVIPQRGLVIRRTH